MIGLQNMTKYKPFRTQSAGHFACDFCGALTRGRVYHNSKQVICGACRRPLRRLSDEEKDKIWREVTNSAGSF